MEVSIQNDERLMTLLLDALKKPVEERKAYLSAECGEDRDLYIQVLEALHWEERMGSFLLEPLLDLTTLIRPFEPGDTVAERFTIVREIGEGGMGVVYEARDRKRNTPIAIKAAKPGFQRLLSPELEGALKVRHHNVCLVNEIHTAQTQHGPVDFLSMELLKGQTLSAHLAKLRKLEHKEALDIACQLCAGLAEAHDSGVLHRDLKTSNVLLCENDDGTCRAVITDFGLASCKGMESAESGGTPGYMAPELWDGAEATKASDIYALGVILYEMVAGIRPDESHLLESNTESLGAMTPPHGTNVEQERPSLMSISESDWNRIAKAGSIRPPSKWTKGLDHRWDRVITRCLATAPADRPQDAHEVLAELKREPIPKWPFAMVGVLALLLMAIFAFVRPARQWAADLIWPPNVRLAVLPFDGPKDLSAIGNGAVQDLAERVQQMPSGRKWPLNKLSRNVVVISSSKASDAHADTPQKARDLLHATHALKVTVDPQAGKLIARASIIDLTSLLPVKEESLQYSEDTVGEMSQAITHFVAMTFGLQESSSDDQLAAAATQPYLEGLYFVRRDIHSFDQAIPRFQQAAQFDPRSALPPAGMALALIQKYRETGDKAYLTKAQEFVSIAQSRNPDSARVLLAAARIKVQAKQYRKALEDYQRILALQPHNADALIGIGLVYEDLGQEQDAILAFKKAQELDPEYYRPYQVLGECLGNLSRYSEAAEEFRKGIARAPGFYDGYSSLGAMLIATKQYGEAEQVLNKSISIRETPMALNNLGVLMSRQGRFDEAAAIQKRALASQPGSYTWLENVADNLRWAGHPDEAMPYYRQGREVTLSAITSEPTQAWPRVLFAYFSARLGDRTRAEQEIKEAVNLAPGDTDVLVKAIVTYEALGERDLGVEYLKNLSSAGLQELSTWPDLADFCQDPRFKEEVASKGGQ